MRSAQTRGILCLSDNETLIEYRVAAVTYTEWESGDFSYEIRPFYQVIDLLEPPLFQGIPGINLSLRLPVYVRKNRTPVLVSERVPAENREDVRALLDQERMEYLNKLEWLVRTKTRYSGDGLYVVAPEEAACSAGPVSLADLVGRGRPAWAMRRLLMAMGRGQDIEVDGAVLSGEGLVALHKTLRMLYLNERAHLDDLRRQGVRKSAQAGRYKGRRRRSLDEIQLQDVCERHARGELSGARAAQELGVSTATFFRRYHEYRRAKEAC